MQRKSLMVLGAVFLGGALLWSLTFFDKTSTEEFQEMPVSKTGIQHIVVFTDEGYQPNELSISSGDEVMFLNKSNRPFWPASNLHPSHRDYPEFDPREPSMAGETWSFVFTQKGEWKFHDHLAPYHTGVIIVAP